MWVLLLRGGPLELRRQGFQDRPVILLESLDQFFLCRSVTGAAQLHDRDRRCANVGLLDIKTRGLKRAEELLDGPTLAIEVDDPTCLFWACYRVCGEKPPMDGLTVMER